MTIKYGIKVSKNIKEVATGHRKITSSSDKSQSVLSRKTGTVTERRTDYTQKAQRINNESKFSETQTNTESDNTVVTRVADKRP